MGSTSRRSRNQQNSEGQLQRTHIHLQRCPSRLPARPTRPTTIPQVHPGGSGTHQIEPDISSRQCVPRPLHVQVSLSPSPSSGIGFGPYLSGNILELVDSEETSLIASFRPRLPERSPDGGASSLVNCNYVQFHIENHKQNSIPRPVQPDLPQPLPGLGLREAPRFYLQPRLPTKRIIAPLTNRRRFEPKQANRLPLRNLPGDPQGATSQLIVSFR
jgi:hypothetical protein